MFPAKMAIGEQLRAAAPSPGINQTSFMFGAVLFAFLFFITVRGDLAKWLGLLGLAGSGAGSVASGSLSTVAPSAAPGSNGLPGIPTTGAKGVQTDVPLANPWAGVSDDGIRGAVPGGYGIVTVDGEVA